MKEPWPILTADEMRAAEAAIFARGVADYALMQQAGRAAAEIVWRVGGKRPALVLCGPGNNGGDGYVMARALADKGVPVRVAACAEPVTESARRARADWGGPVEALAEAVPAAQLIDALFGIGLTRGLAEDISGPLCALAAAADHVYAVDVPSGIATDSGAILSGIPRYDLCIALGALKPAHVLHPGSGVCDRLICCDIGVDGDAAPTHRLARPQLSAPATDVHKYTRGLVAVVAGAMPGAAALAAQAAAHGGAGYVRMIGAQAIVNLPHAIVRASARNDAALADGRIACLLIGPGLGRGAEAAERLGSALSGQRAAVVDADGLIALTDLGSLPEQAILTPHEGEFAALFPHLTGTAIERARAAAALSGAVVILKGATSVAAAPDGRALVSDRAPSWLSTAGTGDVLAGLCAARLAATGDAFRAAGEALWLHGEAARIAGPAFIADDLLPAIRHAISRCL